MAGTITTLDALIVDNATRNANLARHADISCLACGRKVNARTGWMVPLVGNDILPVAEATEDTEWFDLGPECAKRVPLTHRQRVSAA